MKRFKRAFQLLLGFFPRPLPIGKTAFDNMCSYILNLYGIPDLPSYRVAIANMVMQCGIQAFKSPFWFYRCLRAAMAKEVAYQLIDDDVRARNKEERELKQKAFDAKLAEAVKNQASKPAVTLPEAAANAETLQIS